MGFQVLVCLMFLGLNREITVDFLDYYGDVVSGSSTVNLTSVNNSGPIQVNLERQPLSYQQLTCRLQTWFIWHLCN